MSKLSELIKSVAPTIAGVLAASVTGGNPVVGAAVKVLSEKLLGHPNGTQDELTAVVNKLDPEKLAELEFKMKELGFKTQELYLKDSQDARDMYKQTQNKVTDGLAVTVVVSCLALAAAVLTGNAPGLEDPKVAATAGTIVGFMFRELKHVLSFHFGNLSKDE